MRYVAFLRGINVGGHKALTMDALRAAFEAMSLEKVQTIQASGNVLFDAGGEDVRAGGPEGRAGAREDIGSLAMLIEAGLRQTFGYRIGVIVRRLADLERLVASDPFQGVTVTPETRLYVTFLSRPAENGAEIRPPVEIGALKITENEALSALTLSPGWGTTELMAWLEKRFGKHVTTRNWNTVRKIVGP